MTGASSRRKGIRFEQQVANYLGTVTTRSTRPGIHDDAGDIVLDGCIVECKDHARHTLGPWLDEANAKAHGDELVAVVVKRRQRPIGESFVVMTLDLFKELVADE